MSIKHHLLETPHSFMSRWCYDKRKTCWHARDLQCQMTSQFAVLFIITCHWPATLTAVSKPHAGQVERLFQQKPGASLQKQGDRAGGREAAGKAFLIAPLALQPWTKHFTLCASLLIVHVNRAHKLSSIIASPHHTPECSGELLATDSCRPVCLQAFPEIFCDFAGYIICHNRSH